MPVTFRVVALAVLAAVRLRGPPDGPLFWGGFFRSQWDLLGALYGWEENARLQRQVREARHTAALVVGLPLPEPAVALVAYHWVGYCAGYTSAARFWRFPHLLDESVREDVWAAWVVLEALLGRRIDSVYRGRAELGLALGGVRSWRHLRAVRRCRVWAFVFVALSRSSRAAEARRMGWPWITELDDDRPLPPADLWCACVLRA